MSYRQRQSEVNKAVVRSLRAVAEILYQEARRREEESRRPAATASALGIRWAAVKVEQLAGEVDRG